MDIDITKGLFVNDGCVLRKDVLVLAMGFNDDPNGQCSRVVYRHQDKWRQFDVETDMVISIAANNDQVYIIGSAGIAIELTLSAQMTLEMIDNEIRMWVIDEVVEYGEITRVRTIASIPYCCGQCGQVYRLDKNQWIRAEKNLRSDDAPDFEDIDGSSPSDIYAVGMEGAMCHFNGRKWKKINLETNLHLSNIRYMSPQRYYVCGNDGLIMCGAADQWKLVSEPEPDKNYWDIEIFEDNVYLSHGKGIDLLTENGVEPVKLNAKGPLTFHRLHGRDGQLVSFGVDHILVNDKKKWSKLIIPIR